MKPNPLPTLTAVAGPQVGNDFYSTRYVCNSAGHTL